MAVYSLMDEEMKKTEYLAMQKIVKKHAAGWDPESVYANIAVEMKDRQYTDTQGGTVDPYAPRLENRASLEDIADEADPEGDAARPFIDLVNASVEKDADGLIVRMRLADLSQPLTFNQPGVRDNTMEYRWAAMFDMNGDGRDEYSAEWVWFKDPEGKKIGGGIVDNAQMSVWKMTGDGAEKADAHLRGEQKGNELILEVLPCDFVSSIGPKTRVHFKTFYSDGKTEEEDLMPD